MKYTDSDLESKSFLKNTVLNYVFNTEIDWNDFAYIRLSIRLRRLEITTNDRYKTHTYFMSFET